MKIEQGFQVSCSETTIKLSSEYDINTVQYLLDKVQKLTGYGLFMKVGLDHMSYIWIPVNSYSVYIKELTYKNSREWSALAEYSYDLIKDVEAHSDIFVNLKHLVFSNIKNRKVTKGDWGEYKDIYVKINQRTEVDVDGLSLSCEGDETYEKFFSKVESGMDGDILIDRNNIMGRNG